jgi:hypothetical protein
MELNNLKTLNELLLYISTVNTYFWSDIFTLTTGSQWWKWRYLVIWFDHPFLWNNDTEYEDIFIDLTHKNPQISDIEKIISVWEYYKLYWLRL